MKKTKISVQSGELFVAQEGQILEIVLGSCVAFCVYDPRLQIGGVSHFLIPTIKDGPQNLQISGHLLNCGEVAVVELLKKFKSLSSKKDDLQISIIASAEGSSIVSDKNVLVAKEMVKTYNLKNARLHRSKGKSIMIRFDTQSGEILFRKDSEISLDADKPSSINLSDQEARIRLLIVDDSRPMREVLASFFQNDPLIRVIGCAASAAEAETIRQAEAPDVITLDIHMPEKDGLTYLKEIMASKTPVPVIMISEISGKEVSTIMTALQYGAFDYLEKPALAQLTDSKAKLRDLVIAASKSDKNTAALTATSNAEMLSKKFKNEPAKLLLLGASTGGTEALRKIFSKFPAETPPILIVQHMPTGFTRAFAESLNESSNIEVKEAEAGELLRPNCAYFAPGGRQMKLILDKESRYIISISDDSTGNRFKPSVDHLFESVAKLPIAKQVRAALLTGMGTDGARGLLQLKTAGAFTIAQDEKTCVVFGMPREAIELKAVSEVLPIFRIAGRLVD